MGTVKKLTWIFHRGDVEGIPYFQCPYCQGKISGQEILFGDHNLSKCPYCDKDVDVEGIKDEDMEQINIFYGGE